jgi:hypothetical protein
MMGKDARKLQKRKERERKKAKEKHFQRDLRHYQQTYPQMAFEGESQCPPTFVRAVKDAVKQIDLRDSELFNPAEQQMYRDMKEYGAGHVMKLLRDGENRERDEKLPLEERKEANMFVNFVYQWLTRLGDVIFQLIGEKEVLKWIPFNDLRILPGPRDFKLAFRSLCTESTPSGTAYFSRFKPKVIINQVPYIVAFSNHSITRTCDRIVPNWRTYSALGDAFAFFDQCMYFELTKLEDGQLAFCFYDEASRGFMSEFYITQVSGQKMEPRYRYYFKVGYCPAAIEKGRMGTNFLKAITQLPPGYRNTREHTAICRSQLPRSERDKMLEKCRNMIFRTKDFDFGLMRWMHENGCPQVIKSEKRFYAWGF